MTPVYALNHSTFDVGTTALFGGFGAVLRAWRFEPAPLLLGFVLSPPLEESGRRALLFSNGDLTTFATHPISATLIAVMALLLALSARSLVRPTRHPSLRTP